MRTLTLNALALAVGGALLVAQEQAPASYTRNSYYGAGERVEVPAGVNGDVVVAGRAVTIAHPVAGDVLAAGWRVNLTASADDDVRMAGGELLVDARVAGDLRIAGRDVTLGTASHVFGNRWLTGQRVQVNGVVERDLRIAAQSVTIAGEIRRPTRIIAESLTVASSAATTIACIPDPAASRMPTGREIFTSREKNFPAGRQQAPAGANHGRERAWSTWRATCTVAINRWRM